MATIQIPYSGNVWRGEKLAHWLFSSIWRINRSANKLLIVILIWMVFNLANHIDDSPNFLPTKLSRYTATKLRRLWFISDTQVLLLIHDTPQLITKVYYIVNCTCSTMTHGGILHTQCLVMVPINKRPWTLCSNKHNVMHQQVNHIVTMKW